uniref:Uncharacterized protein n=1 Tax=Rhizophora mucronata TaxID=61149 RepID=A0A2P2KPB9_RHIMU
MNYKVIGGREIRIVFAEENRKTPQEMRFSSRTRYAAVPSLSFTLLMGNFSYIDYPLGSMSSGRYGGRGRTPPRSPRRRYHCQC